MGEKATGITNEPPADAVPVTSGFVFLDESGNTGDDLGNKDQPCFVLAGWLVPAELLNGSDALVREIVKGRPQPALELKGSTLKKTSSGRGLMAAICDGLLDLGCQPLVAVYEKSWAMAVKIVANLVDERTNPRSATLSNEAVSRREPLVEQLFTRSHELQKDLWDSIRSKQPTVDGLRGPLFNLMIDLHETSDQTLVLLLVGALRALDRVVNRLRAAKADPFERFWDAPNVSALAALLNRIDDVAGATGVAKVAVCHDETSSFADTLRDAFGLIVQGPSHVMTFENGASVRKGLRTIDSLDFGRSVEVPLLQAADVLASTVALGFQESGFSGLSSEVRDVFERVLVAASFGDVPYVIISQGLLERAIPLALAKRADKHIAETLPLLRR